ncbi:MFS transporter [Virgibacillus doumboii]|uniref:MFS transporter n=1 Tax=Virgibacillus doumboii TaxID=2697503 RepID=UPI0013E0E230|nr:MFS transporter [Virgibacillus doumboii]
MNRWFHLTGYALLIFSSQILWVTFSPITTDVAADMGTNVGNIGTLAALFPIIYIVVALPAGRWLDSHFKLALTFGALTVGLGAAARLISPFSYTWQLIIQIILSIGQPFVINAIAAYAGRYFPEKKRSMAISISSVALFFGVIFAMVFSPILYANGGLTFVLIIFAIPSAVSMVWVLYTLAAKSGYSVMVSTKKSAKLSFLLRDKFLWVLSGLLAIGLGIFDALSTWVEPIFEQYGIAGTTSGPLLALMILSGIAGSVFIPSFVAKKDARRTFIITALLITAGAFTAIIFWQWVPWIAFWLIVDGFFLLAGFPIIMDWTEKHFGTSQQGTAVGFVMLTSHAGGIILIYLVKALLSPPSYALGLLVVVNILGILLAMQLPKREKPLPESGNEYGVN